MVDVTKAVETQPYRFSLNQTLARLQKRERNEKSHAGEFLMRKTLGVGFSSGELPT